MYNIVKAKLFGPALWNGVGFIVSASATILWYLLVLKGYSGNESGALLLMFSTAGIIPLLDLGISVGLVNKVSKLIQSDECVRHEIKRIFASSLAFIFAIEVVIGSLIIFFANLFNYIEADFLACFAILLFAISTQLVAILTALLRGMHKFKWANLTATIVTLIVFGVGSIGIIVGLSGKSVFELMALLYAGAAITSLTMGAKMLNSNLAVQKREKWISLIDPACYLSLLRFSIVYFPQSLAGIFFAHIQRFFVGSYLGTNEIAKLSFAYSLAARIHAVVNAFIEVIFPLTPSLAKDGLDLRRFSIKMGLMVSAAFLPVACLVVALVSIIVSDTSSIVAVYLLGVWFAMAVAPSFHVLNACGKAFPLSMITLGSPFVFVLALMLFISWGLQVLSFPLAYVLSQVGAFLVIGVMVLGQNHFPRKVTVSN